VTPQRRVRLARKSGSLIKLGIDLEAITVVVHIFSEFAAGSGFYTIAELLMTPDETVWLHPQLNEQDEDEHEARLAMQPHSKVIL
jgi:hypothetical protein